MTDTNKSKLIVKAILDSWNQYEKDIERFGEYDGSQKWHKETERYWQAHGIRLRKIEASAYKTEEM